MELSYDIISQFAKVINEDKRQNQGAETTIYGVVVSDGNGNKYVKLDGSDQLTPLSDDERPSADSTTANTNVGDRVAVSIKNHTATVTGNTSSPSVRSDDFDDLSDGVEEIKKFDTVLANRVQANEGYIKKLQTDKAEIGDLSAATAKIKELEVEKANADDLTAAKAEIDDLKVKKLDAEVANVKFATVENLKATNAKVGEISGQQAKFEETTTNKLTAVEGSIKKLDADKLSAKEADIKYAQIDFANIGKAAIEHFYATSGIIKDLVIGDTSVSGRLVGVTIIGDLIEGGTVKADKLVIQGTDGLYYKLNTDGMKTTAEQTDYNSLNGSIITAKSITAEKVNIHDLVAFGATIAGFNINETAIYSGVKDHPDTAVRGIYLDKDGQVSFGDADSYLKYYKDSNGMWRLEIAADNVRFSSSKKTLSEEIDDIKTDIGKTIVSVDVEYYLSTSATSTVGGSWSTLAPSWVNGKYMWSRTVTTYNTGNVEYSPNQNGVCIAGATGNTGNAGKGVVSIVEEYYKSTSSSSLAGGSWSGVYPGWENDTYVWTRSIITYTDNTTTTTEAICVTGSKGEKGDQGARGLQGIQGPKGEQGIAGTNGKTSYFHIKYSSVASPTAASQMSETPNTYIGTYVDYTATDSDDPKKYTWYRFQGLQGAKGDKGIPGTNGSNGKTSYLHIKYSNDGGKTFTANNGETTGDYIGQCTDFNETDPTSVSAYTWSKIKGEKGATGAAGKSIGSVVNYYLATASSSGVTTSTSGWTTTVQSVSTSKKYLWNYEVIKYTDGSVASTTTPCIIGAYGDKGNTGATGATGKGIKSVTEHYAVSASNTAAPTSWSTTVPTMTATNRYLWNYETITYTDNSTLDTTKRVIGVYGDKGNTGATGPQGPQGAKGDNGTTGNLWVNPTFDANKPQITSIVNGVKAPNGSNVNIIQGRDHFNSSTAFAVMPNHRYRIVLHRKRIKGNLELNSGIWYTGQTSGNPYDTIVTPVKTTALTDGWSEATYECTCPASKNKGCVYLQINQAGSGGDTQWYIANVMCTDITGLQGLQGLQGPQGAKGDKGAAGKGVKSTEIAYQASTSGTTIPTGTWSASIPTVSAGSFLWTRTIITYTDNSKSTSYSIGKMGNTGATGAKGDKGATGPTGPTGAAGKGVKSTAITYQAGSSGTSAPTGTWSTSVPATSASKPFLWTKTVITYTDNGTSTIYSVGSTPDSIQVGGRNLIRNSNFNNGLNNWATEGASASICNSKTYEHYLRVIPNGTANKRFYQSVTNLWVTGQTYAYSFEACIVSTIVHLTKMKLSTPTGVQKITVSSDTSISLQCSKPPGYAFISIDITDIVVPGVNYKLTYTSASTNKNGFVGIDEATDSAFTNRTIVNTTTFTAVNGRYYKLKIYANNTGTASSETYTNSYSNLRLLPSDISNTTITPSRSLIDNGASHTLSTSWKRYTGIITSKATVPDGTISFSISPNGVPIAVANIKLEKGNKATDWTPAPEDIDNRFDAAETRITQAETSIETTNNQIALKASTETVTEIGNRANQLDKALSDALTTIKKNSDAIATLNARDFKVQFTTLTDQLTQLDNNYTSYKKKVDNWMRFDADGNLVLGATRETGQEAYELKLTKNRISFMLNDDEVAYISNNELYITNSTVVQNLKIDRFVWEVRGNGNLGLVWR